MPRKTHEERAAYMRQYAKTRVMTDAQRERRRSLSREWKSRNIEKVRADYRQRYARDKPRMLAVVRAYTKGLRDKIIAAYGGKCACCPEARYEFMALDHVNGGGRRDFAASGARAIYRRVIRLGFPPEYRILCHNCNLARGFYGFCPHEKERAAE